MELITQIDVPSRCEGGVHVYYLENAKAEDVAATLQSLARAPADKRARAAADARRAPQGRRRRRRPAELFSGEVKITADKTTNSLVIIACNNDYRNLVKVIEKLDIRRRQVFVEAVIMEVNLDDNSQLGARLHAGTAVNNLSFQGQRHGAARARQRARAASVACGVSSPRLASAAFSPACRARRSRSLALGINDSRASAS